MKKNFLIIISFCLIKVNVIAQVPAGYHKIWDKCLGGYQLDFPIGMVRSSDGYVYLLGRVTPGPEILSTCITGNIENLLIKMDTAGNFIWQRAICAGKAYALAPTNDGGCVVYCDAGNNFNPAIWPDKTCNYTCSGSFITGSGIWLIKIDGNANKVWEACAGTKIELHAGCIALTSDGGFIVTAATLAKDTTCTKNTFHGTDGRDIWLLKFSSAGALVWQNSVEGGVVNYFNPITVMQALDGGYLIGAEFASSGIQQGDIQYVCHPNTWAGDMSDYLVIKTDSLGNRLWDRGWGGSGAECINSMVRMDNGNYLIVGQTNVYVSGSSYDFDITPVPFCTGNDCEDVWVVCMDSAGNKLWDRAYGSTLYELGFNTYSEINTGVKMASCPVPGGAIITSYTDSPSSYDISEPPVGGGGSVLNDSNEDVWVFRIDYNGNKIWDKRIGSFAGENPADMLWIEDGSIILFNTTAGGATGDKGCPLVDTTTVDSKSDWWIIRFGDIHTGVKEQENNLELSVFPNPANTSLNINITSQREEKAEIILQNVLGQKMVSKALQLHNGKNNTMIDVSAFAKGIYFMQIKTKERSYVSKLVKE